MYEYQATILRVIDGDTVDAKVDLGFDIRFTMKLRLFGINAPEMRTPAGPLAKQHLIELIGTNPVMIQTLKDRKEKYGRYLATIVANGVNVNLQMVLDNHAIAYMT